VKAHVGTSGWQYRSWRGAFYPERLPQRRWLEHYATVFPVVEVNNTFYMLPAESTFDRWREQVPPGFRFVVKASRYITHIRRMRDAQESVDRFWSRAVRLGHALGPVLFQFPPNLRADPPLLSDFLEALPKAMRAAFEFREDSWRREDVYATLDRAGAAWVLADRPGARIRDVVTGGWTYVRFHQGRRYQPAYSRDKLRRWADRLSELEAYETWAFFNNDTLAAAPQDAAVFMELLQQRRHEVAVPHPVRRSGATE
jgi:uncharacterized protein YecE (DUF72 family)